MSNKELELTKDVPPDPHEEQNRELMDWIEENRDRLPQQLMAMRLDHDLITAILTRERIRLINHLRKNGPSESMQELADALGRDKTAISRDIAHLEGSLIEVEKIGRRKRIRAPRKPIILY